MTRKEKQTLDLALMHELFETKIAYLERGKKPGPAEVRRFASAHSIRFKLRYPVTLICLAWGISRSSFYRHNKIAETKPAILPQQKPALDDAHIAERIKEIITHSPFPAERHRKLWRRLNRAGIVVSRDRVRCILRKFSILPQSGAGIITQHPDVMWGIDSTSIKTTWDGPAVIQFVIDHCTGECLAIGVTQEETTASWHPIIHSAIRSVRGELAPGCVAGLTMRHDNLPLFRSKEFRQPLRALGLRFSRSPILAPWMNGCAERFVRTLKENLLVLQSFGDLGDLRHALKTFQDVYNREWLLERVGYRAPAEVRADFISA